MMGNVCLFFASLSTEMKNNQKKSIPDKTLQKDNILAVRIEETNTSDNHEIQCSLQGFLP